MTRDETLREARERFEAWWADGGYRTFIADGTKALALAAWQAALASQPAAAAEPIQWPDNMKDLEEKTNEAI